MVLLDTCTMLWLVGQPGQLSDPARQAISASAGAVFVSAISAWEIALKHRSDKLGLPMSPEEWYAGAMEHHGLSEIPISGRIAIVSACLPRLHSDPADRLLVATALERGVPLITPDRHISQYPDVRVVW